MANEVRAKEASAPKAKERHKPVEFMSQLALKRGAKMRGDVRGIDFKSGAAATVLLSHKPDFTFFHNNDPKELADHLHWFDELSGCDSKTWNAFLAMQRVPLDHIVQAIRDGIAASSGQASALQLR